MKKSLLSFVLAFALVFAAAVPTFAATPSDISGVEQQGAIEELVALGVINGYADGTFKPNNNITRAELAKIIVEATGGKNAASLVQNVKPQFSDVKTSQWYTGYINVAATKGFILGDKGTKKFRPNDNIKFEEVVAIIIRALGYSDSNLSGTWPYNVLVKADDLELFDSVTVAQGTLATRAVVAQIVDNSLTERTVNWDADAELYTYVKDADGEYVLLLSKLGMTKKQVLTGTSVDKNKVSLDGVQTSVAANYIVTDGEKLGNLLGHRVTVLYNSDNKVIAISDATETDEIVSGTIDSLTVTNDTYTSIEVDDEEYDFVKNAYLYLNGDSVKAKDAGKLEDKDATLYLNGDGEVVSVVATDATEDVLFDSYIEKTSSRDARVVYDTGYTYVDDSTVVTLNGNAAKVTDLAENDVLDVVKNDEGFAISVKATRNAVDGKVTNKRISSGDYFITVAGKKYEVVYSDVYADIDVSGEYKLFLNADGKVVGVDTLTPAASDDDLAVVLSFVPTGLYSTDNGIHNYSKLEYYSFTTNKVVTEYFQPSTGGNVDEDAPAYVNFTDAVGDVIKFKFNDDDDINGIDENYGTVNGASTSTIDELTSSKITVNDTVYGYNSNVVVIDATDVYNNGKFDEDGTVKAGTKEQVTENDIALVVPDEDGYYAAYVVLLKDKQATEEETVFGGYVDSVDYSTDEEDNDLYEVVLNINGEEKTLEVEKALHDALNKLDGELFVVLQDTDEDGTFEDYTVVYGSEAAETPDASGKVSDYNRSSQVFDLSGGAKVAVTDKTSVFVYDTEEDDVIEGSFADIIGADDVKVGYTGDKIGTRNEAAVVVVVQ